MTLFHCYFFYLTILIDMFSRTEKALNVICTFNALNPAITTPYPFLTSQLPQHVLRQVYSCQEILAQMLLSNIPSVETYPQREFVCENISVKVWFYYISPLIQFLGKNASQALFPI